MRAHNTIKARLKRSVHSVISHSLFLQTKRINRHWHGVLSAPFTAERAQNPTACPDRSTEKMDIEPLWRETTPKTILILMTNSVNSAHSQSFSSLPPTVLPPVSLTPKCLNHLRPISKKIVEIHQIFLLWTQAHSWLLTTLGKYLEIAQFLYLAWWRSC